MRMRASLLFLAALLLTIPLADQSRACLMESEGPVEESPRHDRFPLPPGGGRGPVLVDPGAQPSPFLLTGTEVRSWITGPVAHVEVTQKWENPNGVPVDGLYIFPLPEEAAVNDMTLRIGHRTVRGEMRRREEARQIYEEARRGGRVAGLLDQERANIFAQRVANLAPGARIEVMIAFDHEIQCDDDACEYFFPTVVGPRFIPLRQSDPGAVDPPVVSEGSHTRQRLSMTVDLEAGVPVHGLESTSHRIEVSRPARGIQRVTLTAESREVLNRDFKLRWKVGEEQPEVGLLAWRNPGRRSEPGVFTLILQPPIAPGPEEVAPRELVFVLDCSGSMSGVPLEAAKGVVRRALGSVRPEDTFQILRFSDSSSGMESRPVPPTRENLRRALAYLDSLHGEGGTEMILGIRAALGFPKDPERLRVVAFLTDGYIGNEREILKEVRTRIGDARLFSFGIGSSVNRYLLEGLAEEGRGEAAFLGPRETPDQMVERFTDRIAAPLLTDVRITWRDLEVMETTPERIPDLFAGQPLILHGRYRRAGTGVVEVEGFSRGRHRIYRRIVTLPEAAEDHEALGRLWARARIHQLDRQLHDGASPEVVESITNLGLSHRLMTAYTSLVAVDSEISNWTGASTSVGVPVEMPEDVSYEGIFGRSDAKMLARQRGPLSPATGIPGGVVGGVGAGVIGGLVSAEGNVVSNTSPGSAGSTSKSAGDQAKGALKEKISGEPGRPAGDEDRRSPGTSGGRGPAGQGGKNESGSSEAEGGADRALRPTFTRITLYEDADDGISLQGDGKVYRLKAGRFVFLKSLSDEEMEDIRAALTSARTDQWRGGGTGARIVLEAGSVKRIIALHGGDGSIQALAELLRSLAQ